MDDSEVPQADSAFLEAKAILEDLASTASPHRPAGPPPSPGEGSAPHGPPAGESGRPSVRDWSEHTFRLLLESLPDALVVIDRDGVIVMLNGRTEELFGYHREELLGQAIESLVPERFRK